MVVRLTRSTAYLFRQPPKRNNTEQDISQEWGPIIAANERIFSDLETANGTHQGSFKLAQNALIKARKLAFGVSAPDKDLPAQVSNSESTPGVIVIKRLLLDAENEKGKGYSPTSVGTSYIEEFLDPLHDSKAWEQLSSLVKEATNMNDTTTPSEKPATCVMIYLEHCIDACTVLSRTFELEKSTPGENDHQFILWAMGIPGKGALYLVHHDPLHMWSGYSKRIANIHNNSAEINSFPMRDVPRAFAWEPFGYVSGLLNCYIRRLMFTFEFLVPHPCTNTKCRGTSRMKLLQVKYVPSLHFHTFTQRRSVVVQTSIPKEKATKESKLSKDAKDLNWCPSQDQLCIVVDRPIPCGLDPEYEEIPDGYEESHDPMPDRKQLNLLFYNSLIPSKYRFRPSFHLKQKSENWACPAMVLFVLRDILDAWNPLLQACLQHIEAREQFIAKNLTNTDVLKSYIDDLWKDKENWIFLRSTLEVHKANICRLEIYVAQAFQMKQATVTEMFFSLNAITKEIQHKIEMQLQERTKNLIEFLLARTQLEESHESAETGTSMKRLSLITFFFLPMTFLAGFIDAFGTSQEIGIKWYFIITVLMLLVLVFILGVVKRKIGWGAITSLKVAIGSFWKSRRAAKGPDLESNGSAFLLDDMDTGNTTSKRKRGTHGRKTKASTNLEEITSTGTSADPNNEKKLSSMEENEKTSETHQEVVTEKEYGNGR